MARPKKARPVSVTIYQGADGLWHGYLTVGTRPDGRPDRRHRTGRTREECEQKIRDLEDEVAAGGVREPGRPPTVAEWLTHWCEKIARPSVSYNTYEGSYAYSVYRYLIPGVGAHRLDRLEPEHAEFLYHRLLDDGLSPGTVALVHRTLRAALNEAVRRDKVKRNVALIARSPESDADEIDPLTVDESRRVLAALAGRRNAVRWSLAMLGLRQGEVLGLRWSDVDLDAGIVTIRGQAQRRKWQHGCADPAVCARWKHGCASRSRCSPTAARCPKRQPRCRLKPCPPAWQHGCDDPAACKAVLARACRRRKPAHCPRHRGACPPPCPADCTGHASCCPQRTGGGVIIDDGAEKAGRTSRRRIRTKSKAGQRRMALPGPIVAELREHRRRQLEERVHAGSEWRNLDLVVASVTGGPVDASRDRLDWKRLLVDAGVRDVRGHDARHTAATLLLLKGVDRRVVMDVMGWSSERMLRRYQHVVDEMRVEAATRLGDALFGSPVATDHATEGGGRRKKVGPRTASSQLRGLA